MTHGDPSIRGKTSRTNKKTTTICSISHQGVQDNLSFLVYPIMARVRVPRQSEMVRVRLHQLTGQDVNLQMGLLLHNLKASSVKLYRCHCKYGSMFCFVLPKYRCFDYLQMLLYLNKGSFKHAWLEKYCEL